MRHVYVNRATYILSALLILATVLFAWLRSNNIVLFVRDEPDAEGAVALADIFSWFEQGEAVYRESCAGCHERLGYVPAIFGADGGREYLKAMVLHGVEGELVVDGEVTTDGHPGFADAADSELAAVLNYMLVAWGEVALPEAPAFYTASELAEAREVELTPEAVLELRPDF